jgi:hypothetical protein
MDRTTRSSILAHPERYLLSCIKGTRYHYIYDNRQGYICKRCAEGRTNDCEVAHGFMDGVWAPFMCAICKGPLIKARPVSCCQLCSLAYRYLMNSLGFHGITHEHILRLAYDVNHHEVTDLVLREPIIQDDNN